MFPLVLVYKLEFIGEDVPPAASLLKKAGRKLLQHWYAYTLRHFEPRTAHTQKRERALFVCDVARGVYVLRALARRTKMTWKTFTILLLQTILFEKVHFPQKVLRGCGGTFSKVPPHVLPDKSKFEIYTQGGVVDSALWPMNSF